MRPTLLSMEIFAPDRAARLDVLCQGDNARFEHRKIATALTAFLATNSAAPPMRAREDPPDGRGEIPSVYNRFVGELGELNPLSTRQRTSRLALVGVDIASRKWGVVMDSRRSVLKKLLVGTATAAAVPGTASAALEAVQVGTRGAGSMGIALPTGPAPWWLFAPIGLGTPLKYGWYVAELGAVERGAAVLTLAHTNGRRTKVHICAHNGRPTGLAHSALVDLVLMDGGSGSFRTDEKLGRVVLGLAELIRRNEVHPSADLKPVARMMTHDERVVVFGAESLA